MGRATDSPTVSERLVSGTLALLDAEGDRDLSVRRLAEASERSTMCVYSHFQGRGNLLLAAHEAGEQQLWESVEDGAQVADALRTFAEHHPRLLLWLLSTSETDALAERARALAARLLDAVGGRGARDALAAAVGEAVLAPLLSR